MKTIIHIGTPKTGSTALQNALFNAHKELITHGVLYPAVGKNVNHGLLAGAIRPYEIGPRTFRKYSEQEHSQRVSTFIQQLSNQISKYDPDLLLLSAEYFWAMGQNRALLEKFHDLLIQIGVENVEFVGYVRSPSSYYLSQIQQQLKASSKFKPPGEYHLTHALNAFSEYFSHSKISVRLFDREALVGGDIVSDFMSLHRPELQQVVSQAALSNKKNETLSAEGMVLIQQFRKHFYPDTDDVFNRPTSKFVRQLRSIDRKLDFPRPKLRPEIADYTDYAGTGPLELRDRYGVVFPKLDYGRLERGEFAETPQVGGAVQDVVQVGEDRLEQMVHSLLKSRGSFNPALKDWLRSLPQGKTVPSAFSLALRRVRKLGK